MILSRYICLFTYINLKLSNARERHIQEEDEYDSKGIEAIQQEGSITVPERSVGFELQCPLNQNTPLEVTWTAGNGQPLPKGAIDMGGGTLLFADVSTAHQGEYVCKMVAADGHIERYSVILRVRSKERKREKSSFNSDDSIWHPAIDSKSSEGKQKEMIPEYGTGDESNILYGESSSTKKSQAQDFSRMNVNKRNHTGNDSDKHHNMIIGPVMGVFALLFFVTVCVICSKGNICKSTNSNDIDGEKSGIESIKGANVVTHQPEGKEESINAKMSRPMSFFA